jgi:hypothetical protein
MMSSEPRKRSRSTTRITNPARILTQRGLLVRNRNTDLDLNGKIVYPVQDFFALLRASSINAE